LLPLPLNRLDISSDGEVVGEEGGEKADTGDDEEEEESEIESNGEEGGNVIEVIRGELEGD